MKSGVFSRSAKLLGMASRLAKHEIVKEIKQKISTNVEEYAPEQLRVRIEQAKIIAENLSQLKGAAMKAGQLLSIDSSDILPPEVTEILSQLQSSAVSEPYSLIRSVLEKELSAEQLAQFESFNEAPIASASIGQVHKAEVKGQPVAVKVQYPGITESIDSDLAILKRVVDAFLSISGKKMNLTELFDELGIVLHQEADYNRELRNMQKFGGYLKDSSQFIVPRPLPELSTSKVLTMSFEEGVSVLKWLQTNPSREDREFIGRAVLDLYCQEFFDWGLVQTDPNYGNFLVQTNPLKLVLLDFGATLEYSDDFRHRYKEMLKSFASFDNKKILENALAFGLLDPRESDEAKKLFVTFLKASVEPFLPHHQPFHFKNEDYARRAHEVGRSFTRALKYSAPPRQIIFLHRKLGGIFNLLRKLEVSMNLTPYWEKMVGSPINETSSREI